MIADILTKVFGKQHHEKVLFLFDTAESRDATWDFRISLAKRWALETNSKTSSYRATGANNADLPETFVFLGKAVSKDELFSKFSIVIALTEYSATAPLHSLATQFRFRAASMPGFTKDMVKALEIDYGIVQKEVGKIHTLLDGAQEIKYEFEAGKRVYSLAIDVHSMPALKDDGACKNPGEVINLPSGEAFISPYDKPDSKTKGFLPIQTKEGLNIYKVEQNRIISRESGHDSSMIEKIRSDPAAGNLAEAAFGVLSRFNIKPCQKTLLDEKLGPHIALGRNDHFGGTVSPASFKKPENVWHQDFVYIKELQPDIIIRSAKVIKQGIAVELVKDNKLLI